MLSPKVGDLIKDDTTVWEREPMNRLAEQNQLQAFAHSGFWAPMDTLRDKMFLDEEWASGRAPWRIWDRLELLAGPAGFSDGPYRFQRFLAFPSAGATESPDGRLCAGAADGARLFELAGVGDTIEDPRGDIADLAA